MGLNLNPCDLSYCLLTARVDSSRRGSLIVLAPIITYQHFNHTEVEGNFTKRMEQEEEKPMKIHA